ncbi:ubiquitin carboxyl-terminal hydrolase [Acanthocystis turfacea Chlorella virus TN603.4.2]|nr:ubiquitin carboxyl-terminal hydrolase [Acanthocystis turfacea Chlorella virus TN603.4.2]
MLTFENSDNKCWFIAALQAIIHIPQIANLLRNEEFMSKVLFTKRKNCSDFATALSGIMVKYWSSFEHTGVESISDITDIYVRINRNFAGKKMYDATECFIKIIETLNSAFLPKKEFILPDTCDAKAWEQYVVKNSSTFLSDIFTGQTRRITSDGDFVFDHFDGITIGSNHPALENGIREFFYDPDTNVKQEITKFPLILPVYFQKGAPKPFIAYDTQLKLSDTEYDLFAVILHGNQHWMTICKSPTGNWNLFDDNRMVQIQNLNDLIQRDAMLLLYKKK